MEEASYKTKLSPVALRVCNKIADSGENVFVVGGVLRDVLGKREAGDVDLATSATPEKMMNLFDRVVPTGLKHGTVTVLMEDEKFEVTTLRGEGTYSDGRHPDSVTYLRDIEKDLARRDFTVNAIAWDPIRDVLHDPFGGEKDLSNELLRAVGDPISRFKEDGLRVLRAARFCATHNFVIEAGTAAAMPLTAETLGKVASERKRDEVKKILTANEPSRGLSVMEKGGLLPFVSPDLAELSAEAWNRTLARVDHARRSLFIRLGALFLDVADDRQKSSDLCAGWLKKMRFEKKAIATVPHLIRSSSFSGFDAWSDADVRLFVKETGKEQVEQVMELRLSDAKAGDGESSVLSNLEVLRDRVTEVIESHLPLYSKDLSISGKDLISELNIPPGPEIGRIIDALVDAVIANPKDNQRDILLDKASKLSNS